MQQTHRTVKMAWDPITAVHTTEPLYFGPLAGYDIEELDRKGLDQDKKNIKGFKWLSKKESENPAEKHPLEKNETEGSVTSEVDQGQKKGECHKKKNPDDIPSWDDFMRTTTFHGVRYIFDKTPFKIRRSVSLLISLRIFIL